MAFFVVDLKTATKPEKRVICQFDALQDLETCLVLHFDESHRAQACVFVGRWVDSWDGPYLVPSIEYLKRSLGQKGDK